MRDGDPPCARETCVGRGRFFDRPHLWGSPFFCGRPGSGASSSLGSAATRGRLVNWSRSESRSKSTGWTGFSTPRKPRESAGMARKRSAIEVQFRHYCLADSRSVKRAAQLLNLVSQVESCRGHCRGARHHHDLDLAGGFPIFRSRKPRETSSARNQALIVGCSE
jgi:hypothetical protein